MRLALSALLLLLVGCAKHPLENGQYRLKLKAGSTPRDLCGVAPPGGGLWSGALAVSGESVNFAYELNGQRLVGFYKAQVLGEPDEFSVDGTNNRVVATVFDAQGASHSCPADGLRIHLDAAVDDESHFHGLLQVDYQLAPDAADQAVCGRFPACPLSAEYEAERVAN